METITYLFFHRVGNGHFTEVEMPVAAPLPEVGDRVAPTGEELYLVAARNFIYIDGQAVVEFHVSNYPTPESLSVFE